MSGDRLDGIDHLRPVLDRLIKREELVEEDVVLGLELERLFERLDRLVRVLVLVVPDVAESR